MKRRRLNQQRAVLSNFLTTESSSKRARLQQCPLCQLYFEADKIETHAATCGCEDPFPPSASQASQATVPSQDAGGAAGSKETSPVNSHRADPKGTLHSQSSGIFRVESSRQSPAKSWAPGDAPGDTAGGLVSPPESSHHNSPHTTTNATSAAESEIKRDSNSTPSTGPGIGSATKGGPSAFTKLMAAQAELSQKLVREKGKSTFRLSMVDDRVIPTWDLAHEVQSEPLHGLTVWDDEVTFRDVLVNLQPRKDPERSSMPRDSAAMDRNSMKVFLATNIDPAPGSPEEAGVTTGRIAPSLLKSMLQKGVRRGKAENALRLAVALGDMSLMELLRRLPIIVLEDVSLHPEFPVLVWLMVAVSKGYNPPRNLLYLVFGIVLDIAIAPQRDISMDLLENITWLTTRQSNNQNAGGIEDESMKSGAGDVSDDEKSIEESKLYLHNLPQGACRTLIASLLFRAAYGGLRGDVRMMEEYARLWTSRFYIPEDDTPAHSVKNSRSDILLLPTLKFCLHHRFLTEIASIRNWGLRLILAFSSSAQNQLRRALHTKACTAPIVSEEEEIQSCLGNRVRPMSQVYKEYALQIEDLLPEGMDFHCEPALVQHVFHAIGSYDVIIDSEVTDSTPEAQHMSNKLSKENSSAGERQEYAISLLHSVIWHFRSSRNARETWGCPADQSSKERYKSTLIATKKRLSKIWSIVAKSIAKYCDGRLVEVASRLKLAPKPRSQLLVVPSSS